MNPEVSLVRAAEILPSQIEHCPKGTTVLLSNGSGKRRGRPPKTLGAPLIDITKKEPVETDDQKKAFEYYLSLGDNRTLSKVAEYFTIKKDLVYRWSRQLGWLNRVRILANQPDIDVAKSNLAKYYRLKTGKMVIVDPERPGKLIANPDFSGSAAKEITAGVVALDKNVMDKEAHEREMSHGPGGPGVGGRNRGGVMVNVVIQK